MKGDDPDDMKNVFEDVKNTFVETLAIIKQDAAKMGIDIVNINEAELEEPPEPEEFPLYRQVAEWEKEVNGLMQDAERKGNIWLFTEVAADLSWYKSTLLAKIDRQLCNRWHLDRGDEYGEVDYQYTGYVLGECLKILEKSLAELSAVGSPQSDGLNRCFVSLQKLRDMICAV